MDLETLKQGSQVLFEHSGFIVLAPRTGAVQGDVIVMPQQEAKSVDDLSPERFKELCTIANYVSAILFETLGAHGTNIILVEEDPRLRIEIIARKEGDGLDLLWTPKQLQQTELDEVSERLRDKTFMIGKEGESPVESAPKPVPDTYESENPPFPPDQPLAGESPPSASVATASGPAHESAPEPLSEEELKAAEEKENYLIRQLRRVP